MENNNGTTTELAPVIHSRRSAEDESKLSAERDAFNTEVIAFQIERIREHYLHNLRKSLWVLGDMLNNLKTMMEQATQKSVSDDELAVRLDLDLTGQRIGQIRNTAGFFSVPEYRDDSISFETYQKARQLAKSGKYAQHTPRGLSSFVKKHPSVPEIISAMKPGQAEQMTHRFSVSASRDLSKKKKHQCSAKYDGKAAPEFQDPKIWANAANKAAGEALAHAIINMLAVDDEARGTRLRYALHANVDYVLLNASYRENSSFKHDDALRMLNDCLRWTDEDEKLSDNFSGDNSEKSNNPA